MLHLGCPWCAHEVARNVFILVVCGGVHGCFNHGLSGVSSVCMSILRE
jgi:hypothetical protein